MMHNYCWLHACLITSKFSDGAYSNCSSITWSLFFFQVVLETEITNKAALRLYENLGFVRDKRLFRYYLNGVDALRLKLWLRWEQIADNIELVPSAPTNSYTEPVHSLSLILTYSDILP